MTREERVMTIELTDEQRQAVRNGEPVRLAAPELGGDIVLLSAKQFERLQELLEDERQQRAFRQAGLRSAVRWLKDNPY
jgi:PHD/YefM family antitoxin component YafN of YafNO toxin-antitoxin module